MCLLLCEGFLFEYIMAQLTCSPSKCQSLTLDLFTNCLYTDTVVNSKPNKLYTYSVIQKLRAVQLTNSSTSPEQRFVMYRSREHLIL